LCLFRSPITDSEEEDSAESSTDEEACEENVEDEKINGYLTTGVYCKKSINRQFAFILNYKTLLIGSVLLQ